MNSITYYLEQRLAWWNYKRCLRMERRSSSRWDGYNECQEEGKCKAVPGTPAAPLCTATSPITSSVPGAGDKTSGAVCVAMITESSGIHCYILQEAKKFVIAPSCMPQSHVSTSQFALQSGDGRLALAPCVWQATEVRESRRFAALRWSSPQCLVTW